MSEFLILKNARVSFPHLFTKPVFDGVAGKYGATLLLDPKEHQKIIKEIKDQMAAFFKEKFKGRSLPEEKLCLRKGEDKGRPEYDGYMVLSSNSKEKPAVISNKGDGIITDEEACPIYAGCYVNAKVRLWAQNHATFGKRINAQLVAIQFAGDGDPLDGNYVSIDDAIDGFDSVSVDEYAAETLAEDDASYLAA